MKPRGGGAVMAGRVEPPDSLDFFCTPPWATRALLEHVLLPEQLATHGAGFKDWTCWEPAAGEGHMAEVLREYFGTVMASDVHDYGRGYQVGSFVGDGLGLDTARPRATPDWVITNPPFRLAAEFARRAIGEALHGVAMLVRLSWAEGATTRYRLFSEHPPAVIALFAERVPMHKGRWEPDGDTMTAYAWFVWRRHRARRETVFQWIPPGQRQGLERPGDRARWAAQAAPALI